MREITNLERNVGQRRAHKYIDLIMTSSSTSSSSSPSSPGGASSTKTSIDCEAQELLESLRKDKILKAMDHHNVVFLRLTWKDVENRSPSDDVEYLERFSNAFCTKMIEQIDRSVSRQRQAMCNHSQVIEIHQHLTMCRQRARSFRGRDDLLDRVRLRLQARASSWSTGSGCKRDDFVLGGVEDRQHVSSSTLPIVIHGRPGSGRTSLIAKVACSVKVWLSHCKPIIILRFLGASSRSCSIRLVLGTVCWQLSSVLNVETSVVPDDYPGLVKHFHCLLQLATADRPLVFLLDALDQLSVDHRAHLLAWMPTTLPPNVFFIVSTVTDHPTFHGLAAVSTAAEGGTGRSGFVEVPALGRSLALSLVREWLKSAGRGLTSSQLTIVGDAFSACSLPLYITLVFDEVRRWSSYDPPERTTLEETVEAAIARLLDRIERYHGQVFVSHALGYMTASKDGLSEVEMDDLLSLDDIVLNDVFQHWLPPVRRIPPLLVPRLQDALSSYIVRREANGTVVIYWYNAEFLSVARRRYLFAESQRTRLHSVLGHYFMGTWGGGRRKPFKYSRKQLVYMSQKRNPNRRRLSEDETADRMVPRQQLHFGPDPRFPGKLNYNLRKLSELPHHLLQSGLISELKSQVLFNYDWLHAKLCATSLHEVLHDFDLVLKSGRLMSAVDQSQVGLVASALRVAGSHIAKNPNSLAFDLLGQLLVYYDRQPTSCAPSNSSSELASVCEEPTSVSSSASLSSAASKELLLNGSATEAGSDSSTVTSSGSNNNTLPDQEAVTRLAPVTRNGRALRGAITESGIRTLLQQCDLRSPSHSALLPILPCFEPPSEVALCVLEGHSGVISDLAFLPTSSTAANCSSSTSLDQADELISIAADGTLALWDLAHGGERSRVIDVAHLSPGRRARLFPVAGDAVASLDANGSMLDAASHLSLTVVDADSPGSPASLVDLRTGHTVKSFGDRDPSVQSAVRLSGRLLCRQRSIYDVITGTEVASLDRLAPGSGYLAVAVRSSSGDGAGRRRIVLGGVGVSTRLFDIDTGSALATLDSGDVSSSAASSVALSHDGRLVFVGYTESCCLCVFIIDDNETTSSTSTSTLTGCSNRCRRVDSFDCKKITVHLAGGGKPSTTHPVVEEISELTVNPMDDVRVLVNVSGRHLIVYDPLVKVGIPVDVTSLKVLGGGRAPGGYSITKSTFSGDGRLVVAATDSAFHVWTSKDGQLVRTVQLHTQAGYPLVVTGHGSRRNLVATGSTLHTSIRVWNLDAMSQSSTEAAPKADTGVDKDLPVYDGPVDCMAVARAAGLVFVRRQMSLSTHAGYKYAGWCGLDVWDISTARCRQLLPFDHYGRLLQIETTPDASRLALLFHAVDDGRYVALVDVHPGVEVQGSRSPFYADHSKCSSFVMSLDWHWLATWSPQLAEFKMWYIGPSDGHVISTATNDKDAVTFSEAACPPTFTCNGHFAVYVDRRDRTLVVYGLRQMAPRWRSPTLTAIDGRITFTLRALPVRHLHVMVTCRLSSQLAKGVVRSPEDNEDDEDEAAEAAVGRRQFQSRRTLQGVSSKVTIWRLFDGNDIAVNPIVELSGTVGCRRGIIDVSKDGMVGVDGYLQVFDLTSGTIISRFRLPVATLSKQKSPVPPLAAGYCSSTSSSSGVSSEDDDELTTGGSARELTRVQLTDDGMYVVWTERRVVCVGRVADSTVIACASIHERVTGLSAGLDYGYTVLVGRQDGRVLTARLVVSGEGSQRLAAYRPSSFEDRISFLVDASVCSEQTTASFDERYRLPERRTSGVRTSLSATPLPKISDLTQSALLRRADRPHTVLSTAVVNHNTRATSAETALGRPHPRHEKHIKKKNSGRVEKSKKDHSHLPRITGLWQKTGPVVGRPMAECLVANTDHNGNKNVEQQTGAQLMTVGISSSKTPTKKGQKASTLRGNSPLKDVVERSTVVRRRLALRRHRNEDVTTDRERNTGDSLTGGLLKLNIEIARTRLRDVVATDDGSSTTTASDPKTMTSSAKALSTTLLHSKHFSPPKPSPIFLRRISMGGKIYGEDSNATVITPSGHLNHRDQQQQQQQQLGRGGEMVQTALHSSGRMMLNLCGFSVASQNQNLVKSTADKKTFDSNDTSATSTHC